tara:strand:+ start:677 stop:1135 length:459 start_codon:yes stop_codon:yes gene_type:complete
MFENPDFVDPSTMKGKDPYLYDYNSWSPCIDNGDPEYDDPDGTRIDIGAKYFVQETMDIEDKFIPTKYSLSQNYPNPFNPTTTISYSVPLSGLVSLKLYNTLGDETATVVDGIKDIGYHSIQFDGSHLPSGVYFYKLGYKNNTITKKLILMK